MEFICKDNILSPNIVALSVVWIIQRWLSREEWEREKRNDLCSSWQRGNHRQSVVEPTPEWKRKLLTQLTIKKVSDVTSKDFAGVSASLCVCVCVFCFSGVMSQIWRVDGGTHGGRLMAVLWKCAYAQVMYLWHGNVREKRKIRLAVPVDIGE